MARRSAHRLRAPGRSPRPRRDVGRRGSQLPRRVHPGDCCTRCDTPHQRRHRNRSCRGPQRRVHRDGDRDAGPDVPWPVPHGLRPWSGFLDRAGRRCPNVLVVVLARGCRQRRSIVGGREGDHARCPCASRRCSAVPSRTGHTTDIARRAWPEVDGVGSGGRHGRDLRRSGRVLDICSRSANRSARARSSPRSFRPAPTLARSRR